MEEEMKRGLSSLTFALHPNEFGNNTVDCIAQIPPNIADRQELLSILAKELNFPDYFGRNWDALDEVLRDFSWVKCKRIVIVHHNIPFQLGEGDLRTYLDILMSCVEDWKPGETHELVVVFPLACREAIQSILNK